MKMSKRISWLITDQNITVNYDNETHIVKRSDALGDRLIKALKENRLSEIPSLVSTAKRIETFSKGAFVVVDGRVQVNGSPAAQVLSDKIIRFSNDGLPFQPLLRFAENLNNNPSFRAVQELYTFLEKNDHPITESGNFIAYKRVRDNFKDIHSNTFDNSVGNVVSINRNEVDEDSNRTCSKGLHVANWDYAHTHFASSNPDTDVMLEVEVNPADVVAIPTDYSNSKMRVCRYTVLGVVTQPYEPTVALRVINQAQFDSDLNDEDEVEECENCGAEVYGDDLLCEECQDEEASCEYCDELDCLGECQDEDRHECSYCGEIIYSGECDCQNEDYPYEDELE
jgi:hypothetical protein